MVTVAMDAVAMDAYDLALTKATAARLPNASTRSAYHTRSLAMIHRRIDASHVRIKRSVEKWSKRRRACSLKDHFRRTYSTQAKDLARSLQAAAPASSAQSSGGGGCIPARDAECFVLDYLDTTSLTQTMGTCRRLRALGASHPSWSERSLDLSFVSSYQQWRSVLTRLPWHRRRAAAIKPPAKARSLKISLELLASFTQTLQHIDLSSMHPLAAWDFMLAIMEWHICKGDRLRSVRLPTAVEDEDLREPSRLYCKMYLKSSCQGYWEKRGIVESFVFTP